MIRPLLVLAALLVSGVSQAQAPITLETPTTEPPVPRLRLGGEIGGGIAYGANDGGTLAGFLQLGAQVTRQLGVFYQGGLFGFGYGSSNGTSVDGFATSSHQAMVDLTFGRVAQVGIGGGVDIGRLTYCDEDTGICAQDTLAAHASLSIRAAFLVAFVRERARWGIPIALHAHTILWNGHPQNALVLSIGFSRY